MKCFWIEYSINGVNDKCSFHYRYDMTAVGKWIASMAACFGKQFVVLKVWQEGND